MPMECGRRKRPAEPLEVLVCREPADVEQRVGSFGGDPHCPDPCNAASVNRSVDDDDSRAVDTKVPPDGLLRRIRDRHDDPAQATDRAEECSLRQANGTPGLDAEGDRVVDHGDRAPRSERPKLVQVDSDVGAGHAEPAGLSGQRGGMAPPPLHGRAAKDERGDSRWVGPQDPPSRCRRTITQRAQQELGHAPCAAMSEPATVEQHDQAVQLGVSAIGVTHLR